MWGHLLLSIVFNLLFKITPLANSFVTSYMISTAVLVMSATFGRLFFAALILVLLSGAFAYMDVLVSHDTAYRILAKLRNIAYDKIDELAPAAMEGRHSGELTSIVLEDVETLEWFYAHTIGQLAGSSNCSAYSFDFVGLYFAADFIDTCSFHRFDDLCSDPNSEEGRHTGRFCKSSIL